MSAPWCPNLVARTTWSRRPASTSPSSSSLLPPPPYMSAVSSRVIPASMAASTTERVASASSLRPKLLQPSPATDTSSPESPSDLYRIALPSPDSDPARHRSYRARRRPPPALGDRALHDLGWFGGFEPREPSLIMKRWQVR